MDGLACDQPCPRSDLLYILFASLLVIRISTVLSLHLSNFSIELSHSGKVAGGAIVALRNCGTNAYEQGSARFQRFPLAD